jgi:hypothetical protein
MIPLCSRFDSVLFTPKTSAIASYGNYSRSPVVIYAPIFNLLESPFTYYQISILSQVKAQHLDFAGSIKYLFSHVNEMKQSELQAGLFPMLVNMEGVFFLISSVFAAESLTTYLLNDQFKTYLAVWLSSVVSFFPTVLLSILKIAVVYNYVN